jgi:SpoVK/Ycf46/Vps4 family AAA+-type ATPase
LNAVAHRLNIDLDGAESSLEDNEESNDWLSESNLAHEIHDLANRCYKSGSLEEAAELYDLVLEIAPDTLESFFNRGLARCRLRSYELAAQDLRHVIQMNPDLAEAYYTLGLIEQYRGDLDAAIAQYEKAFEVDPKYEKARQELLEAKTKKQEGASPSSASSTSTTDDAGLIRDFSVYARKPDCNFAMVGGCWAAKRQLRLITEYLRGSQLFQKWGIRPPRGVLLYGPSGTGKTLLAEALAGEVDCPCYMPPVGIFQSVWAGYTEANFRRLWEEASSHRAAIIFLDEFDSLASCRSDSRAATGEHWYNRIVGAILGLMSSSPERLVVIAATNCLHNIDPAFLRPGRFEYLIPVDMPTAEELAEIWLIHLQRVEEKAGRIPVLDRPLHEVVFAERQQWLRGAFCDLDMSGIVGLARLSREQGLTGADVAEVVRRVAASRLEVEFELNVDFGPLSLSDFRQELKGYQVSVHRRLAWAEEET